MKINSGNHYKKWKRRDIAIFFERLELYLMSGLTIDMALRLCRDGVSVNHRNSIEGLIRDIESGVSLSQGLSKYLKLSMTFVGMVRHGETTGGLISAIKMSRESIEKQDELTKKCVGAMVYPSVIGIFCIVFVIALMKGVMPQIVPMLQGLNTELPMMSKVMIFCSQVVSSYGLHISATFIAVSIIFAAFYRKNSKFKYLVQLSMSHVPLIGRIIVDFNIVVFLRSMGALVESDLSVARAFGDSVSTITYIPMQRRLSPQTSELAAGCPLYKAIENVPRVKQYVVALVSAGESSGTLGISLLRSASILDRDIENLLKKMTSLIEPLMMIAMGMIVGSIALSIIMPIYDISKTLQH